MHLVKQLVVDYARHTAVYFLAVINVFAQIFAVCKYAVKAVFVPLFAPCRRYSSPVQIARNIGVIVAAGKHFKHFLDYGRGFLVYGKMLVLVNLVAVGNKAAEKLAL
ncbi:MAG: hypothetical protein K2O95_05025 [Clostridia bacterium]|nr:hypothetical protein [Clostridia bacterium]